MVDIVSSSGWLQPALEAMEFCQLLTQGLWTKDSWLMQLPHFSKALAEKCAAQDVSGVFDVLDLEDKERADLLGMTPKQLADVVAYAEAFPDIELNYQVSAEEAGLALRLRAGTCSEPAGSEAAGAQQRRRWCAKHFDCSLQWHAFSCAV